MFFRAILIALNLKIVLFINLNKSSMSIKIEDTKMFNHLHFKLLLISFIFVFLGSLTAYAADGLEFIKSSNVVVIPHLADGYIELKIPFYTSVGNQESLLRDSYFEVNGKKCLEFRSSNKNGDTDIWQQVYTSDDDEFYRIWVKRYPEGTVKSFTVGAFSDNDSDLLTTDFAERFFQRVNGESYATFIIYLNENLLGKGLEYKLHLNPDENDDDAGYEDNDFDVTGTFSGITYATPDPDWSYSNNAGKFNAKFSITSVTPGSKYIWDTDNRSTATVFSGTTATIEFYIANTEKNHTLYLYHKVSDYQYYKVTASLALPAYPQAENFTVIQLSNGNSRISWNVNTTNLGSDYIKGDQFEIQRADNEGFSNPIGIARVDYVSSQGSYSIEDETSEENLNGNYYYRIRRTASQNEWGWELIRTALVNLQMAHKNIVSANAQLLEGNISQVTWDYDDGNVWTEGTSVILERYNVSNGGVKEVITIPADSLPGRSYSEELFQMCNKFNYKIYVKPGCSNYTTAEATNVEGNIVPVESGQLLSVNASKGYFSDHVELSWKADGLPIDYFIIKSRIYESGNSFKQILQVSGTEGSELYQTNDEQANPGEIYEYQVIGVTNCADVTIYTDTLYTYGFRAPTGDIYGRVTFENGQAEKNVEVRMESDGSILGKSLVFTSAEVATVTDTAFLKNNTDSITIQAWIAPDDLTGNRKIISKPGMYELGIDDQYFYFLAGADKIFSQESVGSLSSGSDFVHVTGVSTGDSLFIYVNGELTDSTIQTGSVSGNLNQVTIGDNFSGAVDEVRIWSRALSAKEVKRDYNRYLTGGEEGLIAYYTFNYTTANDFYDRSYVNSNYNENHGQLNGVSSDPTRIPTNDQLGYRGVTEEDGSYSIRAIPYSGNGTVYTIIPRLDIHKFEPEQEIRFIGEGSETFTVNFTDKSSFDVTGTITYEGGTVPVQGVSFTIDGVAAMDGKGNVLMTDAKGEFEISVPVGSHEVIAKKANHVFENDGRITNSYGVDLNYQDEIRGLELTDITKIKYIGRVAGGAIQDSLPLGHSLSTNNLADGITVTLTTKNPAYAISSKDTTIVFEHFVPSNKRGTGWSKNNSVIYSQEDITIYPNIETGEFIAEVIPESFTVTVNVPGHDDIPGSGEDLNLTQQFTVSAVVNNYVDSTLNDTTWIKTEYSDTITYQKAQKFIKRYSPEVRITQVNPRNNQSLPYFGNDTIAVTTLDGSITNVPVYNYNLDGYVLGYPVFIQGKEYKLKAEIFEKYNYYNQNGTIKANRKADEIPTQDATVNYINNIAESSNSETSVEANDEGIAYYTFNTGEPELTSAKRRITATISYGSNASATSIPWADPFEAIVLGYRQTGKNFVTAGPDEVLTVLRDPPGSNSYSYLEKGTTISSSKTYSNSVTQSGSETVTTGFKQEVVVFTGVGVGTIETAMETESGVAIGVEHEEQWQGENSKTTSTSFSTMFQTSSDESYVGADADVYIGYSTNITYGTTNNITIVSKEQYGNGDGYELYDKITPLGSNWYLVQKTGLGVAQTFSTLFAYSQRHIEEVLIPELTNIRDNILIQPGLYSKAQLQQIANDKDTVLVVSKLESSDENYGKSNSDLCFHNPYFAGYDGPSYQIIFPDNYEKSKNDTILYLNQTINNWIERMKENEEAKVNAELLQNYSFQGGASIEYSEQYSTQKSHEKSWDLMIGPNVSNDFDTKIFGAGVKFEFNESIQYSHGNSSATEQEASHSKGFVLEESGDDYISVDVCRERDWDKDDEKNNNNNLLDDSDADNYYSSFIFKTKAGATSCPYEGAYTTKYFEPEKGHVINEATMKIEVPEIAVENDFIENVPSGGTAYFTLYLRNNSEVKQDNWFTLKLVSESNPDGAKMYIDGAPIGNGLDFSVPAGETLVKTLEVTKGSVLNYDNLKLVLESQCQSDIADTVLLSVHFIPSCTQVEIIKPAGTFTYNTKLPADSIDGVEQHYLEVRISGFDVNYDNFNHIGLQYKSSAESDDKWKTLMKYYNDSVLYQSAIDDGSNAAMINSADAGTIKYLLKMDDLPDQLYDLRAVSVCEINNEFIEYISESVSGIKDMYCPRLFGSPQPADGILTIEDDIRLNFNEQIADGLLTKNNFQVKGIRNGAQTDHSVSVHFDGINDYMATEFEKNQVGKDITAEMWIKSDEPQNATLFVHGDINESIGMELTSDNHLKVWVGGNEIESSNAVSFEAGTWAHVSFVYSADGYISAYYNFNEVISNVFVGTYSGIGNFVLGSDITSSDNFFNGYMHNVRVWNTERTSGELQVNSLSKLSGNEPGLLAYYPMNEARGDFAEDNARGANMLMNGCTWTTPEGRAISLNGSDSYVKINTGSSAVIRDDMDYTIELWFKGEPGQSNAALFSNGRGDGQDYGGSDDLFFIGFDANGKLVFRNNGFESAVDGDYLDNDWHHLAINVGRTIGRGQIYVDGEMMTYFSADELGGIASAYMYIGARGWYDKNASSILKLDNYFKGQIDEVRIWNLYKYEQQIQDYNNVKLDGTEMGLLAYYPFEYYKEWMGVEELDYTLADMKIQEDPANSVPEASGINVEQVSDIPPVKDKGPVSDLDFDFVVNNDALIIYLEETPEKIEKTIVTFTVDGIQDINGNEIISPVTWSAYIDRNMLKWGETSINLTKPLDEALTFTVKAVNKGGAIENYYIQNLPSWMSASPGSGTIGPNSSIDITFKIDEGLNVGTYNENVYLTNSDNVSEVLEVNVAAKGNTPDWSVNPADYEYNMPIYAKLRINNLYSNDPEDMIAAFSNGECIGVAHVQYEERNDMWYAFLIIYNNQTSVDDIDFKIWDASTGTVYFGDPGTSIDFKNNSTVGSPASPRVFNAGTMVYQNIDLEPGWNWISVNLDAPAMNDINKLLDDMNWDSGNFFKSEVDNMSANYSAAQQRWIGQNSLRLKNELMYKLSSSVNQSILVSGTEITPSEQPINITGSLWNYIGYLPSVRMKIDEALAGYDAAEEDVIKSQDEFAMFAGNIGWVGSLTYMEPGEGYMLYRKSGDNTTITYPDSQGSLTTKSAVGFLNKEFVNHDYSRNMSLVAISDEKPQDGDRILVYSGNELNAKVSLRRVKSQPVYFITIPGYAGQDVWFELERNGEVIGRTNKVFNFVANNVTGTLNEPFLLEFSQSDDLLTAFPNPAKNEVMLLFSTEKTGRVDIRITDITGRTVYTGVGEDVVNGQSRTTVDCSGFEPGMYFALVTVEGVTRVIKIEKQ